MAEFSLKMFSVEVRCLLALLATFAVQVANSSTSSSPTPPPPPRCTPGLVVDCRLQYEDLVWSKDEKNECLPILNPCLYDQANCARYRQGRPLLQKISKEECQGLCVNDCSEAPKETICAHRDGRYCTFPSQCEWSKHLCNTGEYWYQEGPLPCGENPESCFP